MFENFANVWTIVAPAADLKPGRPLARRIAGERVVFFRGADGKPGALIDRCPHRGVALSLGRVCDGEIECPFHGWRFDTAGNNRLVPWDPDAKRETLGAVALPVREAGGLLWLFTGFAPTTEPSPSPSLAEAGLHLCAQEVEWSAHWTRVMENMLDTPHLPFVHAKTIGRGLRRELGRRLDMKWEETSYGGRITSAVEGAPRPGKLDYRFPNVMELFIDPPGKRLRLMVACLPQDEQTTRLLLFTLRDFARFPLLDPLFRRLNRRIANEDKAVVESSLPVATPAPGEEASVRNDAPTLAFRRLYRQRLLGSRAMKPDASAGAN